MAERRVPERTCVGCRQTKPKKALIRVVRSPVGEVSVDPTGKKPGRGAYICPDRACLEAAVKGKRLERALEHPIPPDALEKLASSITSIS